MYAKHFNVTSYEKHSEKKTPKAEDKEVENISNHYQTSDALIKFQMHHQSAIYPPANFQCGIGMVKD